MKTIYIKRLKKFASALMPYWIITDISKSTFMEQQGLSEDILDALLQGKTAIRLNQSELDRIGSRILNGHTIKLEISESVDTLFACTITGFLSKEIHISDFNATENDPIIITTAGGWNTLSGPVFVESNTSNK